MPEKTEPDNTERTSSLTEPLTVVGLGASAGGLKALQRFFDHTPRW